MTTAKKCMFVYECFTYMFTHDTRIENHRYRSDTRIRKYKELALCPDSPVSSLFVPLSTVSLSLPQNRTGGKWSHGSCQTFLFPCRKRKVRSGCRCCDWQQATKTIHWKQTTEWELVTAAYLSAWHTISQTNEKNMTTRTRQEKCPNHYTYHAKTTTGILRPRKRKETRNLFVRTKGVGWKCLTRVMRSHSQTCAQVAKQESLTAVHSTHPTVSGILSSAAIKHRKCPGYVLTKGGAVVSMGAPVPEGTRARCRPNFRGWERKLESLASGTDVQRFPTIMGEWNIFPPAREGLYWWGRGRWQISRQSQTKGIVE